MSVDLIAACCALALSTLAIAALRSFDARLPHDSPNARSLHQRPIPRAGGYAIWIGFLPVALWIAPDVPGTSAWLPAWAALVLVSALDDARGVAIGVRLAVHAGAALWTAFFFAASLGATAGVVAAVGIFALALTIAWSTNLFNFMDGSDGLAAAMALVGFCAYALAARGSAIGIACIALAASVLPFFAVNRPPASMFMGDVGAAPLGYLAATFGIAGVLSHRWPAWFPLLVFLPFVADATITLARRILRHERFWLAHRSHYYQRLHRLGAGHLGVLLAYGALMIATASTALGCLAFAPDWGYAALIAWCAALLILFMTIGYYWGRRTPATP
jgi:UDP-N-acetylmuramyl pentapeptide phosphotransferase/UDP-N-acetylglucosamine-1-phosphate transferase